MAGIQFHPSERPASPPVDAFAPIDGIKVNDDSGVRPLGDSHPHRILRTKHTKERMRNATDGVFVLRVPITFYFRS